MRAGKSSDGESRGRDERVMSPPLRLKESMVGRLPGWDEQGVATGSGFRVRAAEEERGASQISKRAHDEMRIKTGYGMPLAQEGKVVAATRCPLRYPRHRLNLFRLRLSYAKPQVKAVADWDDPVEYGSLKVFRNWSHIFNHSLDRVSRYHTSGHCSLISFGMVSKLNAITLSGRC